VEVADHPDHSPELAPCEKNSQEQACNDLPAALHGTISWMAVFDESRSRTG
jgi:hypothetical protein